MIANAEFVKWSEMSGKFQIFGWLPTWRISLILFYSWPICILVSELIHINAYLINNSHSFVLSEWTIIMLMDHIWSKRSCKYSCLGILPFYFTTLHLVDYDLVALSCIYKCILKHFYFHLLTTIITADL